jgi:hypothetical protein
VRTQLEISTQKPKPSRNKQSLYECRYHADQIPLYISFKSRQLAAFTRCHVPYGFGHRLPIEMGSSAATCHMTPDLVSWLRWVSALSCVPRLWTSPLGWGGLWRYHVSYGFRPRLPVEVGSGAITCPTAPDLTSRLRWALALPCVIWLRTSPPGWGELRRCHVPRGSGPHLLTEVDFGAAICPMNLDLASRLRWALALPCILWLWTSPPDWGGLWRCHMSRGSLCVAGLKYKEKSSRLVCAAKHVCSQRMRVRF